MTTTLAAPKEGSLVVVTRPRESLGFQLAGVRCEEVPAGEEAARLRALLADPAVAFVALEDAVGAAAPAPVLRIAAKRGYPVVVPFSIPRALGAGSSGPDYVAALIRRFIGYHVKLGGGGAA